MVVDTASPLVTPECSDGVTGSSRCGDLLFTVLREKSPFDGCDEILHTDGQNFDATLDPALEVDGVRVLLNRPRLEVLPLLLPLQPVQHHPEIPVAQAVTEEEEVAVHDLCRESDGK